MAACVGLGIALVLGLGVMQLAQIPFMDLEGEQVFEAAFKLGYRPELAASLNAAVAAYASGASLALCARLPRALDAGFRVRNVPTHPPAGQLALGSPLEVVPVLNKIDPATTRRDTLPRRRGPLEDRPKRAAW